MKNRYFILALFILLFFGLGACGSDDSTGAKTGADTIGGDVAFQGADTSNADAPDTAAAPGGDAQEPPPAGADTWVNRGGVPKIGVDPTSYAFSYVSPMDHTMVKQVNFYNGGYAPLVITSIELAPDSSADFMIVGIPVMPLTLGSGKQGFVNVGFLEKDGGVGTLRISSNDPDQPLVEVALSSILKAQLRNPPEACAGLSPSALNFGTVVRGYDKVMTATLTNCSTSADLTLNNITRSQFFFFELSDEYQLKPTPTMPATLAPGESVDISVEYKPKLAGVDTGYFALHTDDPTQPVLHLDLTAVGVAPPEEELGLTIKLSWDADLCDVDSHLIMPGGAFFDCDQDCHFGNPAPDWGVAGDWIDDPFLDVDDIDGHGPEHINISEPSAGTYTFVVHYYRDNFEGSPSVATSATVEVSSFGQLLATFGPEPLDATNRTWDVFTIDWPSKAVNKLGNTFMLPGASVTACLPFSFP